MMAGSGQVRKKTHTHTQFIVFSRPYETLKRSKKTEETNTARSFFGAPRPRISGFSDCLVLMGKVSSKGADRGSFRQCAYFVRRSHSP